MSIKTCTAPVTNTRLEMQESSPLAARIATLAVECSDKLAIRFRTAHGAQIFDRAKLWRRIERTTAHLYAGFGIGTGMRVGWLGPNHDMQLVTLVACARLGAVFVPFDNRLTFESLQRIIAHTSPDLLIHDVADLVFARSLHNRGMHHIEIDALIDQPSRKGLRYADVDGAMPSLWISKLCDGGRPAVSLYSQNQLLTYACDTNAAQHETTGIHVMAVEQQFDAGNFFALTLPAFLHGMPLTLHPRFDINAWFDDVETLRPTQTFLTTRSLQALIHHPRWSLADLSSLRALLVESKKLPPFCLQACVARNVPIQSVSATALPELLDGPA